MAIHISRFNPEHGRPLSPFAGGTTGRNKVNAIRIQQFSHPRLPRIFHFFLFLEVHRSTFESVNLLYVDFELNRLDESRRKFRKGSS